MKHKDEFDALLRHRPDAPLPMSKKDPDWRNSVHLSEYRRNKADSEVKRPSVEVEKVQQFGEEFFDYFDIKVVASKESNPLKISSKNLLWMKFTADNYAGVVAQGKINFQIPPDKQHCNDVYHPGKFDYIYHASGVLCCLVEKIWNESFVLAFRLTDIPEEYSLEDIKRALGNHLIDKGVPIIDYYSHQIEEEG